MKALTQDPAPSIPSEIAMHGSACVQIGVHLSLYSGKTRSYLLHKGIPFVERGTNPWEYYVTFRRHGLAHAVPVVITPQGEWLQDTSVILDTLERRFPQRPILPATPVLRFASYLFELWGDEFWLPHAMHARWAHDENLPLFVRDVGDALLPGFPRRLREAIGRRHARLMRSHPHNLGATPAMSPVLDRFLQIHLDALDRHFAAHRFLFGGRPSLGDFGLIAPLYAHLGRDPWPKRELIAPRVHLKAWIERMFEPASAANGEFWTEDRLPATLLPALRSIFDELLPFLAGCATELRRTPVLPANTHRARRFLGPIDYPMAGGTHRRPALSYPVWMAQRLLAAFRAMAPDEQRAVRQWLRGVGDEGVLALDLPPVVRAGLAAARTG